MAFDPKTFLKSLTKRPGIYQMFDDAGDILYVGKAKNLKNRLSSYFRKTGLTPKTVALVKRIEQIDVTVTETETEALILEHNLIGAGGLAGGTRAGGQSRGLCRKPPPDAARPARGGI